MQILKSDNNYKLINGNLSITSNLPAGLYDIQQHPLSKEFSLIMRDEHKFKVPSKIYGNYEVIVHRITQTFDRNDKNLGVLFVGEKGTGKSLLAKHICNLYDLPIVILDKNYDEGDLIGFINSIPYPIIILIDEFEKIYSVRDDEQTKFLSLMDGTSNSKIMFILTANDKDNISRYMLNRTSRIRYVIDFESLTEEQINEVLDDRLDDSMHRNNILRLCIIIGNVNYDILIDIISEVNAFNDSDVNTLLNTLNVSPSSNRFEAVVTNKRGWIATNMIWSNPLVYNSNICSDWMKNGKPVLDEQGNEEECDIYINTSDYNVEVLRDKYIFTNDDYTVTFRKMDIKKLVF